MASKELINKVALSSGITKRQAEAAISTILAALQDASDDMEAAAEDDYEKRGETFPNWKHKWTAMLNASPLGEQSE